MSVVVSSQDTGVCRKQLTIEIPAGEVEAETRKVLSSLGKQVRLPGFRPGKVPPAVLRQRFREDVDRQVLESLLPRFWQQAREEKDLDVLGQPELTEVPDLVEGEPLRFVAQVEVRPPLELGELPQVELPEPATEPSEEDVDQALDELRRRVGDWVTVERAAARGDRVKARIVEEKGEEKSGETAKAEAGEGAADAAEAGDGAAGEAEESGAAAEGEEIHVEVGDPNVWEELSLAVTGLSAGQEGHFTRRPPEGSAGEPRSFRVTVEAVEERELPPLDDQLAALLGDFETVAELREAMTERLRHDRNAEADSKRREALMEQLRQRYPLPLPEGVVSHEVQNLVNGYAEDMGRRGIDPSNAGIDWNKVGEEARPHAERRVHDRLLLDAVAEHLDVRVADADVEVTISSIARSQGVGAREVQRHLGPDGVEGLRRQLRREKAMKHLLGEDEAATDAEDAEAPADAAESEES